MSRINRTRYVVLGLLTDAPKSGYDIKREIGEVTNHFWRESFGQIYPTLQQLCSEGLTRKVRAQTGPRQRTLYSITAAGRRELEAWLAIEPEPGIIRHELLLKLFFGRHTDPEILIDHVQKYRDRVAGLQAYLQEAKLAIRAEVPIGEQPYWMLPVRSGELVAQAGITWADEALAALRRLAKRAVAVSMLALALSPVFPATGRSQDKAQKLDEYLNAATALGRFSGAVLVAQNNSVIVRKGYGMANLEFDIPNTPETRFRIGSVTKPFTATAIMLLQQRGRLAVSDPICKYVTECPATWREVTLHHLLSHTSGIPNYAGFPDYVARMREQTDVRGLIERFRDKPLDFAPGSAYRYSNSGYILLGDIIERVSGQGYGQFVRANILVPLGMPNSGYDVPARVLKQRAAGYSRAGDMVINAPFIAMSTVHSAGALYSTVDDLYAFDQALLTDKLLTAESRATMVTPVLNGSGYGWGVGREFGRRHIAHNGQVNGFTSILSRYPDDGVTVIVLTNSDQTTPGVDRVARDLAAIVFGAAYDLPRRPPVVTVDPRILAEYVGEYELAANYRLSISRGPAGLIVQLTASAPYEMRAESDSTFAVDVVDARISFVREGGAVTYLILHKGTDQRARRVRQKP